MTTASTLVGAGMLGALLLAACGPRSDESTPQTTAGTPAQPAQPVQLPADCTPLETRSPNAPDQQPASAGQTRACGIDSNVQFEVEVVATGLAHPWSVEPLPGGDLLVTERPGRMRIVSASGDVGAPIAGLPEVDARGQGGLLDVALSPSFATDRRIYWSYAQPRQGGNGTAVATGVLSADRTRLEQVQVIFRVLPTYDGTAHFGSRLAFGQDGRLYITTGDRSDAQMRPYAQRLDSHLGKILRIDPDGTVPDDNPFVGRPDAQPEIWSVGHRNIQAMTFDAQGRLWSIEHGTRGGDELNLIERAANYGWPIQAYGIEYSGRPIPGASPAPPQFVQPVYYWDPVIAPSGAQWYTGDAFPAWRGSLFIGALREQRLVRLVLDGNRVTAEEHLLDDRNQRIRDVRQGPDGALYIVTDEDDGELWRVAPR
ncbi:MAG TPA: PQQ-dependent sugar dehydrogenase [Longimicrobiales bacterium]